MIIKYSNKMTWALFYMSLFSIFNLLFDYMTSYIFLMVDLATFVWQVFNSWFIILLLDLMCRGNINTRGNEAKSTNFTTWGYFWRGSVVFSIFIPIWVLFNLIFPLNLTSKSMLTMLLMEPLILISSVVAIWTCFSKTRVSQFKYFINIFRGFKF